MFFSNLAYNVDMGKLNRIPLILFNLGAEKLMAVTQRN